MKKNRAAFIKFITILVISAGLGFIVGYTSMANSLSIGEIIENYQIKIIQISPVLLFTSSFIIIFAFLDYFKGKKLVSYATSTQKEEDYDQAEKFLEKALSKTMYLTIASFTSFGIMIAGFAGLFEKKDIVIVIISIALFITSMILATFIQLSVIKQIKLISPEKKGYVLDTKFQKEWFDSCDEAEKAIIGQASYKSYMATSKAIIVAFLIFTVMSMLSKMGPIPMIVLGGIWFVQYYTYAKASKGYDKK